LGAQRIRDPTTAGNFCRRSRESDIMVLMDAVNWTRKQVWAEQPPEVFALAILDADGTLVETDAECKQGIDIAHVVDQLTEPPPLLDVDQLPAVGWLDSPHDTLAALHLRNATRPRDIGASTVSVRVIVNSSTRAVPLRRQKAEPEKSRRP